MDLKEKIDKLKDYQRKYRAYEHALGLMQYDAATGMMVGQEGKTQVPIYQNYTERGFDPTKHILQSYGTGWQSAAFLEQERQLFGAPGGILEDWDLKTNIDGIYAAGDQLFASDCAGSACATGYYAGRKAADYTGNIDFGKISEDDVTAEQNRLYHPLSVENGIDWRELNMLRSKCFLVCTIYRKMWKRSMQIIRRYSN